MKLDIARVALVLIQVVIEGTGSSGNDGDIAIDDVSLIDGPCTCKYLLYSLNSISHLIGHISYCAWVKCVWRLNIVRLVC